MANQYIQQLSLAQVMTDIEYHESDIREWQNELNRTHDPALKATLKRKIKLSAKLVKELKAERRRR